MNDNQYTKETNINVNITAGSIIKAWIGIQAIKWVIGASKGPWSFHIGPAGSGSKSD